MITRAELIDAARLAGFHHVRFATVGPTPHGEAFTAWLAADRDGEMSSWTRTATDVRLDPRARMPSARSVMVLAVEHHHRRPPDPGGPTGLVARYAWGRDYHNLVGKRLRKLKRRLEEAGVASWGGVDTAPILERSWASEAGLGFSGKNTLQIWPARTSWMFLGALFLSVDVEPDAPLRDHCGRCARCLTACPTQAFAGPRDLDPRRCIAYWTIEARGLPPPSLRAGFGRWLFGCDVCQEVCPHNVSAPDPEEDDLLPRNAWIDCVDLLQTPDEDVLARYTGTPLRRPGAAGLKRNALLVLANLGAAEHAAVAHGCLAHPSPVVRAAAVWCLNTLTGERPSIGDEDDPLVLAELQAP